MQDKFSQHLINENKLPLVVSPSNDTEANPEALFDLLASEHDWLHKTLLENGGILFRGFNIPNADTFSKAVKSCQFGSFAEYKGGTTPRKELAEGVFSATEAPPEVWIPAHNEMSYAPNYPSHIYFCCNIAPKEGGATPITDGRKIYKNLRDDIRSKLEEKQVLYKRHLFEEGIKQTIISKFNNFFKTWQEAFGTQNKNDVEKFLNKHGFDFHWLPNNKGLNTSIKMPAFRQHPDTNETVWFNQVNAYNNFINVNFTSSLGKYFNWVFRDIVFSHETIPFTTAYGDGTAFTRDEIEHLVTLIDDNLISFPWEKGDFLLLDNMLTLHARASFKGPRKIMASLTVI